MTPLRETATHQILMAITFFRELPCKEALARVAGLNVQSQEFRDGLAKLQQLSMITEENGRYSILSITREYALQELEEQVDRQTQEEMKKRWLHWYMEFTKRYGGEDWEHWHSKFQRLDDEWLNIESVLYWHASHEDWGKVLELWEQIDAYVDLKKYWNKRRHWWTQLQKHIVNPDTQARALSEKAWTLILMGCEYFEEARGYLNNAWNLSMTIDIYVRADIANHLAILEKANNDYEKAQEWLDTESEILSQSQSQQEKQYIRHKAQNLFYRAEINYCFGKRDTAKQQFEEVLSLCTEIRWERFCNYARNGLADILIEGGDLTDAEDYLKKGLWAAQAMGEKRRIALFEASYARFYYCRAFRTRNKVVPQRIVG